MIKIENEIGTEGFASFRTPRAKAGRRVAYDELAKEHSVHSSPLAVSPLLSDAFVTKRVKLDLAEWSGVGNGFISGRLEVEFFLLTDNLTKIPLLGPQNLRVREKSVVYDACTTLATHTVKQDLFKEKSLDADQFLRSDDRSFLATLHDTGLFCVSQGVGRYIVTVNLDFALTEQLHLCEHGIEYRFLRFQRLAACPEMTISIGHKLIAGSSNTLILGPRDNVISESWSKFEYKSAVTTAENFYFLWISQPWHMWAPCLVRPVDSWWELSKADSIVKGDDDALEISATLHVKLSQHLRFWELLQLLWGSKRRYERDSRDLLPLALCVDSSEPLARHASWRRSPDARQGVIQVCWNVAKREPRTVYKDTFLFQQVCESAVESSSDATFPIGNRAAFATAQPYELVTPKDGERSSLPEPDLLDTTPPWSNLPISTCTTVKGSSATELVPVPNEIDTPRIDALLLIPFNVGDSSLSLKFSYCTFYQAKVSFTLPQVRIGCQRLKPRMPSSSDGVKSSLNCSIDKRSKSVTVMLGSSEQCRQTVCTPQRTNLTQSSTLLYSPKIQPKTGSLGHSWTEIVVLSLCFALTVFFFFTSIQDAA